ncbi:hypothetical protein LX64_02153 [Chitinophaga skermanii]|uniref:Outer membrane protein with beta-barrel domain n=1 Tax=Chitinophaga skermanii TaxID=331697 RepID=A0A327QTM9_9BACT|nr:hypothetical protein [Chitinophaga skermanii]RAJ07024.1 hypothetical protein LX64_02153 [Chitinophaga skermanii]
MKTTLILLAISCMVAVQLHAQKNSLYINIDQQLPQSAIAITPVKTGETPVIKFIISNPNFSQLFIQNARTGGTAFNFVFDSSAIKNANNKFTIKSNAMINGLDDDQQLTYPILVTVLLKNGTSHKFPIIENDLQAATITLGGSTIAPTPPPADVKPTGIAYYDALKLAQPGITLDQAVTIISNYYFDNPKSVEGNKFLTAYLKTLTNVADAAAAEQLVNDKLSTIRPIGSEDGSIIPGSGLTSTAIIDGIARFLVKRTKEELTVSFFSRFQEVIEDDRFADVRTLFPATTNTLKAIGDNIYDYQRFIDQLRESFQTDIKDLIANAPGIIKNHPAFFAQYPALVAAIKSASYIGVAVQDGTHPGEILENYPTNELLGDPKLTSTKGIVLTAQMLSNSLKSLEGEENYWVTTAQLKKLTSNKLAVKLYLGLLYQHANNADHPIYYTDKVRLDSIINLLYNADKDIDEYKGFIVGFSEKVNAISSLVKKYKEETSDSVKLEIFVDYTRKTMDMVTYSMKVVDLPHFKKALVKLASLDETTVNTTITKLNEEVNYYFSAIKIGGEIVSSVNRKSYSYAVNQTLQLYNLIYPADKIMQQKVAYDTLVVSNKVRQFLLTYGGLGASLAVAKNSDDVAAAIETYALPSGSSRIKRTSAFNVSLNAYVGFFGGFEFIKGLDTRPAVGITAPIGVAISKGQSILFFNSRHKTSSSIFISVLDIGAVTAYRFNKDNDANQLPTVEWKDVISPGVFYSFGIGKTPLSVNMGYQMGPLLRKVESDIASTTNSYGRLSLSILVDIPLLNFHTRTFSKQLRGPKLTAEEKAQKAQMNFEAKKTTEAALQKVSADIKELKKKRKEIKKNKS